MNLLIADLNHSIELDQAALTTVVGALKYLSTTHKSHSNWSTTRIGTSSAPKTKGFWPWNKRKVTEHYKHFHQKRTQFQRKNYLDYVSY